MQSTHSSGVPCTQGGPSPLMDSPTSPTDAQPEDGKALEGGAELEPSDKQAAQVFESALEPEPQVRPLGSLCCLAADAHAIRAVW